MHRILTFMVLATAVSCRGSRSTSQPRTDAHVAATHTESGGPSQDDLWCVGDTTTQNADPGRLVREFLARDAAGEFLSTSPFWFSATECAGEGTDYATVIASYSIDSIGIGPDTARFAVTYRFLGDLVQSEPGFVPRVRIETDTFVVIHRRYGWRIIGQHDLPILDQQAARAHWRLTSQDLVRLDSAARQSADRVVPN